MVKKVFYFSVICGLSHYSTAQVGIGTDNPQATLHIVPKDDKDPLKLEGLKEGELSSSNLLSVDNQGVVNKVELSKLSGRLIHSENLIGTDEVVIIGNDSIDPNDEDIPGLSVTYKPSVDCTALITVNTVPIQKINSSVLTTTRTRLKLKLNNDIISERFISISISAEIRPLSFTTVVNLDANKEYTFKVTANQAIPLNTITFNKEPELDDIGNGQKSTMTILFYSR